MNLKSILAVTIILSSFGLSAAQGKTLRNAGEPAEFPPASYKGKQYVDSRGCSYIRAGIDGLVQWVPHVTRKRQVVCGQKPTFGAGQRPAVVAAAPAKKPVQIVPKVLPAQTPVKKAAPKVAPKPKPVVQPKPVKIAPKPMPRVAKAPRVIVPQPVKRAPQQVQQVQRIQPSVRVAPAAKVAPQRVQSQVATRRTSCTNFTGVSAQYAGRGSGVRCGSQKQAQAQARVQVRRTTAPVAPVAVARQPKVVVRQPAPQRRVVVQQQAQKQPRIIKRGSDGQINASGTTRVVPRHVYDNEQASKVTQKVPKGYRPAWTDDRLNTKRANMTVNGIRQSDLVWTRTVPRKLYLRSSGRVVNNLFPKLRYPYTSMRDQDAAMGLIASTRNEPKPAKTQPATTAGRFVQVGTYSQAGNAKRAASKLQAAGLPVRMGTLKRSGKSYRVVMAGPFAGNQLNGALSKARRAGFSDAFVR
ncbi:SPOR domain-containing protein [Lentibacter algarum]|uniref:SPOR domain-containing protein n=1 Tax=Lentibacter algarum TaxID=576131 RepID=UPI001C06F163|nr:SPOR domain-containing protein [Lentibacter algarum]MBU2981765.1 SPOR domain-containing protein [Lentibacter algarum]